VDKAVVFLVAAMVVGLIIWWFFGKRTLNVGVAKIEGDKQVVEVIVDGGYQPSVVELQQNIPAQIIFIRKDSSACFEEVVFPDFEVSTHLPIGTPHTVFITPDQPGEYKYSCGMSMFFGKVIVK